MVQKKEAVNVVRSVGIAMTKTDAELQHTKKVIESLDKPILKALAGDKKAQRELIEFSCACIEFDRGLGINDHQEICRIIAGVLSHGERWRRIKKQQKSGKSTGELKD